MNNPWWSKTDPDGAPAEDAEPALESEQQAKAMETRPSPPPQRSAPAPHQRPASGDSLGEQIDGALGEFEERLAELRETLESRKAEIIDLETEIETTEKEQAKAFKELLADNPAIKKMLNTSSRRKTPRKRTPRKAKPDGSR